MAEVLPFRDLFTSLFFVSVGMLIDPWAVAAHGAVVALLSGLVVVGKFVIVAVIILLLGLPGRVAVLAGLSLATAGAGPFTSVELTDGGATAVDAHLALRTIPGEVPDETLTAPSTPHEQMV